MELHIWGPAFGLPSIDAECNAAAAYLSELDKTQGLSWVLIANHDPSITPGGDFPALVDGGNLISGYTNITRYLACHPQGPYSLNDQLNSKQQADAIAFSTFIQFHSQPLIDLWLYSTYENYYATTRPAFTALLPWHANYVIPPARRAAAKTRTAHLGLTSLHVGEETENSQAGQNKPVEQYEAAKKAAGLDTPAAARPSLLPLPQSASMKKAIRDAQISDRFKLDALTSTLFDLLDELLETQSAKAGKQQLLMGSSITSVDCLAFGYLSLMFYPKVPQTWLADTIETKYPRVRNYIERVRKATIGETHLDATEIIKSNTTKGDVLPWRRLEEETALKTAKTISTNLLQLLPLPTWRSDIVNAEPSHDTSGQTVHTEKLALSLPAKLFAIFSTVASALAVVTFYQIRHTAKGSRYYSFESDRRHARSSFADFGEAGAALAALGNQIRLDTQMQREQERMGGAPIAEVDVEIEKVER